MKRTIISLSLLLGFSYAMTHAKPHAKAHNIADDIKFGIAAGAVVTDLNYFTEENIWSIDDDHDNKFIMSNSTRQARWGGHTSVFGSYQLFQYLALVLSIEYVNKGNRPINYIGKANSSKTGSSSIKSYNAERYETERYEKKLYFNYLQTNVQLNIFPGKDRQFFLVTGVYAAYLLTATSQTQHYIHHQKQGEPEIMNFKEDISTRDKLNNIDIGIALGLGYEFDIGLILILNGSTGLRKIVKDDSNMRWTNLASQLSLGYNFTKLLK